MTRFYFVETAVRDKRRRHAHRVVFVLAVFKDSGERADCVLFYSGEDVRINRYLIERGGTRRVDGVEPSGGASAEAQKQRNLSTTTDCLRAFIQRYFGEVALSCCSKCSNCAEHFEPSDVTLDAQKIVSCVPRRRARAEFRQGGARRHSARQQEREAVRRKAGHAQHLRQL